MGQRRLPRRIHRRLSGCLACCVLVHCRAPDLGFRCTGRVIGGLAAGPLPAHHRGTRCKYVPVSSVAASMPPRVPRRWAGKDQSRWSVLRVSAQQPATPNRTTRWFRFFQQKHQRTVWRGVLAACGTVGGMDAAIEPPWMDLRRVPRAVRAPRPRGLGVCCRALARPRSRDTLQVRPCKLRGGIPAAKGPATVSGQGPVELIGAQGFGTATSNS